MRSPLENEKEILECNHLTLNYLTKAGSLIKIFDDISFSVKKGQSIGLWGPSGSGKSSLFYILMGLQKPTQGQVIFKEKLGLAYQQSQLNPWLTCKETIELQLNQNKNALDPIQLLDDVNLKEFENHLIMHLSGGQKQRMSLVSIIASGATMLLLDEPFGRLDSKTTRQVKSFLFEIKDEYNLTILMASHFNQHFVNFDYVYRITDQRIELVTPQELIQL